jgi:hypothetical protein
MHAHNNNKTTNPENDTWQAIGFNNEYSMPETEVMWLGLESGEPKLRYKRAKGYSKPADIGEVEPENLVVENTEKGLQATWTRSATPLSRDSVLVFIARPSASISPPYSCWRRRLRTSVSLISRQSLHSAKLRCSNTVCSCCITF